MKNFISIPKPCNENWNTMTPQEQGRHCATCNIVVKDFTAMSNEEILDYLKRNNAPHCGRTRENQLNTPLEFSDKLKKFIYALVIIFIPFSILPTEATGQTMQTQEEQVTGGIDGKVLNSKGESIPFALVMAYQNDIQIKLTKTDINGNYKLKPLAHGKYTLKISRIGYNSLEVSSVEIKSKACITKNFKMSKPKSNNRLGIINTIIVGNIRTINFDEPNEQKISGDHIRGMFGGR